MGICGGFQMLGQTILDPGHVESDESEYRGLDLLDIQTTMIGEKKLKRVETLFKGYSGTVSGYEIHHGKTDIGLCDVIMEQDSRVLGAGNRSVWGTYLHGLFDDDYFRRHFINGLRIKKEWPVIEKVTPYDLEPSFKKLAATVRSSLSMNSLYKIMKCN